MDKFNILQVNIQSLRPLDTREELTVYLKREEIKIASLQETWIKPEEDYKIKGYKIIKKNAERKGTAE